LVALFSIGVVWLALFLIVNLVHAFWISFGPMAGPGPQPIPPNSPWGGNPGGSGGESSQIFRGNGQAKDAPETERAESPPRDENAESPSTSGDTQSLSVARDTPIGLALAYIRFRRWGPSFLDAVEAQPSAKADAALDAFLRAAAIGAMQVWGKPQRDGPFERIDKSYWREHAIDRLSLLKGIPFTKRAKANKRPGTVSYADLMTSKAQVGTLWPSYAGRDHQSEWRSTVPLAATRSAKRWSETVGGRERRA
jgi:hypothetical protein